MPCNCRYCKDYPPITIDSSTREQLEYLLTHYEDDCPDLVEDIKTLLNMT